jgi:two-component system sensor histidine kinase DesK
MSSSTVLSPNPAPVVSAARAMARMHRYTTWSMFFIVVVYGFIGFSNVENPYLTVSVIVALLPSLALVWFWERRAPLALAIGTLAAATGVWWTTVFLDDTALTSMILSLPIGILLGQTPRWSWRLTIAGLAFVLAPLAVAGMLDPARWSGVAVLIVSLAYVGSVAVFWLNRFTWNRYLELDAARYTGEQLAIAQERFRFAADLHDIQGHTLHVLRLKTQLADRLLDTDPAAAHAHLAEAQALISETLANTRSLAFGDRQVAVASELANATELFHAAGIACETQGQLDPTPHEELFALLIREATTNILRHAQSTRVTVVLSPGRVTITNDGSPTAGRTLSGLARLASRFEAAGGSLTTSNRSGTFVTEGVIR